MDLTFYGGINEIGGNKILLQEKNTSIFLDFGISYKRTDEFFEFPLLQPSNIDDLLKTTENGFLLMWDAMLAIVLIAITWDLVENTLFIGIGIKFENRRDSVINIFSDVFFVSICGLIMIIIYLMTRENFYLTLIIGILALAVCIILFFIRYRQVVLKREEYMKTR